MKGKIIQKGRWYWAVDDSGTKLLRGRSPNELKLSLPAYFNRFLKTRQIQVKFKNDTFEVVEYEFTYDNPSFNGDTWRFAND
jgi:hypothetical protein